MTSNTKTFRVKRRIVITATTDLIRCSSPVTAVVATDNLTNFDTLVRQIVRDGPIIDVEFSEFDGALVEEVNFPEQDTTNYYDFEEDDLTDIKESFGMKSNG